ncbi:MAG TPA: AAA family ATPase, partial [Thermoplasmata archaeon]|nr:AAA family ATPase [Thermoplasmata archaeon]
MGCKALSQDQSAEIFDKIQRRIPVLEERTRDLVGEARRSEGEKRFVEGELIRLQKELKRLKAELERLKTPPLIIGQIKDMLADGRVVVKSSTGPDFVVSTSDYVAPELLVAGARVALNKQTLAVMGVLPPSLDPVVVGAEIITKPDTTYDEIGGLQEQIIEIREAVEDPLLRPELYKKVGIDPPKGVLLVGPPGTGKTLLAKAVAKQTNATFIRFVGSELVQKYIGEGARLVRELFDLARQKAPSIVFIDELDSVGAKRLEMATSGDREVQRTLMQLLAELDGFNPLGEVKIIGATNRPDILDEALLRPGRFDRIIEIPLPNHES